MKTKEKMNAIVTTRYGSPEVLKFEQVEKPTPKDNEVLIKICATSVTTSDVLIRGLKASPVERLIVQIIF